jgi:antitoxin HigA-1
MTKQKLLPIHPGKILKEEFIIPAQISQAELARRMNVSLRRINDICQERRGITFTTAYRLAHCFRMGSEGMDFWLNLQQRYERECWKDYLDHHATEINEEIQPLSVEKLIHE